MKAMFAGALLLGLGACATAPQVEVVNAGSPPADRARTFQLDAQGGDRQAELTAALTARLARAHLRPAASAPDLRVEAAYSRRPGEVGAYKDAAPADPQWLARPVQRRWWQRNAPELQTVSVVVFDARTGHELYRAAATQAVPKRTPLGVDELLEAALGRGPIPLAEDPARPAAPLRVTAASR